MFTNQLASEAFNILSEIAQYNVTDDTSDDDPEFLQSTVDLVFIDHLSTSNSGKSDGVTEITID